MVALDAASTSLDIASYDPMQRPVWTLLMSLAWIATKNIETVTWQRNEWRRANGLPDGSIPTASMSAGEEFDQDDPKAVGDPTAFMALEAFDQLLVAGQEGRLEVHAMSAERGQPTLLLPTDWTYGRLSFDRQLNEVWSVGSVAYHTLTIERDNLFRAFPAVGATASRGGTPAPRKRGRPAGTANWPSDLFIAELVARLVDRGTPSKVKPGWETWEAARLELLQWFSNQHDEATEPSDSTSKRWVKEAREKWEAGQKVQ